MKLWDAKKIKPMSDSEGKAIYSNLVKGATKHRQNAVKKVPGRAL